VGYGQGHLWRAPRLLTILPISSPTRPTVGLYSPYLHGLAFPGLFIDAHIVLNALTKSQLCMFRNVTDVKEHVGGGSVWFDESVSAIRVK
jgi:hypothetical protein